jgi:hypothetical protein
MNHMWKPRCLERQPDGVSMPMYSSMLPRRDDRSHASPGVFERTRLLDREETIARLNALITFLAARK